MTALDFLRFKAVSKRFDAQGVLNALDAEISLSGITYVVGRSGAGKSVLCRLAVGLLSPDAGEVELLGQRVDQLSERKLLELRRSVPYLVQGPALLDWLSVEENVALAAPTRARSDILKALARVGLQERAAQRPVELGPGLQKRVAIARALVLAPRYLLLDEPTTGLDRPSAQQVNDILLGLKREGLGALVVSHDYRALADVADAVLVVAGGKVAFQGPVQGFLSSTHQEVQALRDALGPEAVHG